MPLEKALESPFSETTIGHGSMHTRGPSNIPGSSSACRRFLGPLRLEAKLKHLLVPGLGFLPLSPQQLAKTTANPLVQHLVIGDEFFGCALEEMEGMEKAAVESLLSLGVGEFQIEEAAVAFEDGQAVELPLGFPIGHRSKMAPVHLALLAGKEFKADEGFFLFEVTWNAVEIVLEDGDAPLKALGSDPLKDHGGRSCGIDVQEPLDLFLEGVQFAGPLDGDSLGVWVMEIFSDGFGAEMEGGGNLFLGPALVAKAVDFKDSASIEHGYLQGNG